MENKRTDCEAINIDIVEKVRPKMPEMNLLYELSDFFKVMAQMTGTGTISCRVLVRANWMVVMSEMVRVVMEAVPNWRKS